MLIIFNFLRKINSIAMDEVLEFDSSILFTLIMFLSEFIAGFFIYIYEVIFYQKRKIILLWE